MVNWTETGLGCEILKYRFYELVTLDGSVSHFIILSNTTLRCQLRHSVIRKGVGTKQDTSLQN
jgi:hypothetical protein